MTSLMSPGQTTPGQTRTTGQTKSALARLGSNWNEQGNGYRIDSQFLTKTLE